MRQQYEQNPYPRWTKTAPFSKAQPLDAFLAQRFPLARRTPLLSPQLDYLIAGCGTGQQVASVLLGISGIAVTAVDLSLASLGYAKRMTDTLGLPVSYGQADILELGQLGRTFDVVDVAGVLHHMADPLAGWRVLVSLVRPGGFMRVALYSTLARRHIAAAQRLIAAEGWPATPEGIRAARQAILALPDTAPERRVAATLDFFSLSECRDLLFHVQEHTFDLPAIAAFLSENELDLLGFDVGADVVHRYAQRFPEDTAKTSLDDWNTFEQENPDVFLGMYHVLGPEAAQRCGVLTGRQRAAYTPSFALSRSFTACGLALPPEAFITWPTNQPSAFGFVFASATLSGFLAMISSTTFSIAPVSVTCFMPRASTIARGSPPSLQTISNRSLAILPEMTPSPIRSRIAPSCAAETGDCAISLPSLFSRPASSLITQLAAAFASRPLATASKKSAVARSAVSTPAS